MKIVFFGDSITEANRNAADPASLGDGYVSILHEKLKNLYEDVAFECLNRGVGGNSVSDLAARVQADVVAEKPDIVVLLAGINDVWRLKEGQTFDASAFAADFESILSAVRGSGAKLIVAAPFLFDVPDKRRFRRSCNEELGVLRPLAEKYADAYVALDEIFAGVSGSVGIAAYSADGVHPTHRASRLIADNVIKKIRKFL